MSRTTRQQLLLILALAALVVLLAVAPLTEIQFWAIDLYTFRAAAKAMMQGADPYDVTNISRFAGEVEVGNIHNYLYAPYFAFALRPLAWLPPVAASRVWFGLNLLMYLASLGLIPLIIGWMPKPRVLLPVIVALILFPPLRTALIIGQSTILMLFILAASLLLLRQQRPLAGGLLFSLGLFKPHLFPLLLFFLIYRQWRWLAGAGLGLLALNLPLVGWLDNWWTAALETRAANLAIDQCFQMVSLVSLLNCTLPWSQWLTLAGLGALSALLLVGVWRSTAAVTASPKSRWRSFDRRLALFLTLSLLLIDHTRIADQLLLLFPLLVAWRDWPVRSGPIWPRIALFLTLLIYVLPYMLDFFGPGNVAYLLPFWYIGLSSAVLLLLLLELRTICEPHAAIK